MEASILTLVPILVKVITDQIREDLLHMLMGTKCCRWSKNKVKRLHDLLVSVEPDIDAIQEAVRRMSLDIPATQEEELEYEEYITEKVNEIWPHRTEI